MDRLYPVCLDYLIFYLQNPKLLSWVRRM